MTLPQKRKNFSEGRARQVRCAPLDDPSRFGGRDKRFSGHDKRAAPMLLFGGTCLSGPLHRVGSSLKVPRA